jgi:hypothetical protein
MMTIPKPIQHYISQQARENRRVFVVGACDGIDQVVVIPALAEKQTLLETLHRLSANRPSEIGRTLVICVINNRDEGIAYPEDIENNRRTMMLLRPLISGDMKALSASCDKAGQLSRQIISSGLRLAYVDASSRGMEMPEKGGGVGMARKLGLDIALSLFDYENPVKKLLFNLDADAWVEPHYLSAVRYFFETEKVSAAVVSYSHRPEQDSALQAAICCYEIFLRYYVLGLGFAGSPYAFHTIGSTMICTPESYVAVRGMNRRDAAEDFYFLDKLAKLAPVARISTTTVYPSGRPSRRVPFGTGRRMIRFLEGRHNEYLLYDPEIFRILKRWLEIMVGHPRQETQAILAMATGIHPLLGSFLELNRFQEIWPRIRRNHREPDALLRQFHVWFDGFKTMKLIHYLTENSYPQRGMFSVLKDMFDMMNIHYPDALNEKTRSNIDQQLRVLNILRQHDHPNISLT